MRLRVIIILCGCFVLFACSENRVVVDSEEEDEVKCVYPLEITYCNIDRFFNDSDSSQCYSMSLLPSESKTENYSIQIRRGTGESFTENISTHKYNHLVEVIDSIMTSRLKMKNEDYFRLPEDMPNGALIISCPKGFLLNQGKNFVSEKDYVTNLRTVFDNLHEIVGSK